MADRPNQDGVVEREVIRTGPRWGRIAALGTLIIIGLLLIVVAAVWVERRPIAIHFLKNEFDRRGVQASYHLDRVGFRTQQVSNLVVGDPKRPDVTARFALIQLRLKWNGGVGVYRHVTRRGRLRGRLVNGKVSGGHVDKLLPPPTNKPFQLPDITL